MPAIDSQFVLSTDDVAVQTRFRSGESDRGKRTGGNRMDQANPAPDRDSTSESNNDSSAIGARNWHILRRRHPRAAQRLQGVDPYPGDLLHTSKTGEPILSLVGEDGVERPLHSRFRPVAEAETQIPDADDPLATYIVLGGGLGYLPRALAGPLTPQNRVVWVERDLRLFRTLLDVVDVTSILDRPLTSLALGDNTDDFNWENYLQSYAAPPNGTPKFHDEDMPSFESTLTAKPTLTEHLLWQLNMLKLEENDKNVGMRIIGNINEDGYLTNSVESI